MKFPELVSLSRAVSIGERSVESFSVLLVANASLYKVQSDIM